MAVIDGEVEDPILALRNAIIKQAADDYIMGLTDPDGMFTLHMTSKVPLRKLRNEAALFFESPWCDALLSIDGELTGAALLHRLIEHQMKALRRENENRRKKRMKVTLIQQTPDPIDLIARIASVCYDSQPKNKKAMIKRLYLDGHHSPFEHVYFTFHLEGISRACSHQLVRHRLAAFTQRSQRYCPENGFDYVTPKSVEEDRHTLMEYKREMSAINSAYVELVHLRDVPKEDARFLLPNACTTEMYLSCNLRELIHICNERLCSRAQWEIREVVRLMAALVHPDLQWMLVPKCQSGFLICNNPCSGKGYKLIGREKEEEKT